MSPETADAVARMHQRRARRDAGETMWTVRVYPSGDCEADVHLIGLRYAAKGRVPVQVHHEVTRVLRLDTGPISAEEAIELAGLGLCQLDY